MFLHYDFAIDNDGVNVVAGSGVDYVADEVELWGFDKRRVVRFAEVNKDYVGFFAGFEAYC